MAPWIDSRASWRRWYQANKKAQKHAKFLNRGRRGWGSRFWYAIVRVNDFRRQK